MPSASDALVLGRLRRDGVLDLALDPSHGLDIDMVLGWIAKESGAKLGDTTSYDERGYFQLMPDESRALGIDHARLSTDPTYSMTEGLRYVGAKSAQASQLGFPSGELHWRVTKLIHTVGYGGAKGILDAARAGGADMNSWESIRDYGLAHDDEIFAKIKHRPSKWLPLVDDVFARGQMLAIAAGVGAGISEALAATVDTVSANPRVTGLLLLGAAGILVWWYSRSSARTAARRA